MPFPLNQPIQTVFGQGFINVDESEATSADFEAPKKENKWCLVEMSKEHVEALEAGQLFHIKAHSMGGIGSAALSTATQTFGLEFLENSNPMYLGSITDMEPSEEDKGASENKDPNTASEDTAKEKIPPKQCSIFAQCRGNVFLKPAACDVQKVRDILAPSTEGSASSSSEPVTTSLLQYKVAASPKELAAILKEGPYVEKDGQWSFLSATFEREVTDVVLNLVSLNGWDLALLDLKDLLKAVQENFGEDGARYVPSEDVLQNAVRDIKKDPVKPAEGEQAPPPLEEGKIALDADKVDLFHASQLLRESPARLRERYELPAPPPRAKRPKLGAAAGAAGGGSPLQIEEFCGAFSAKVGKEKTIEELCKILGERMYIDEMDGAVHPLDVTTLPQEPRERLQRLFELSSHWRPERITPLMAPAVKGVKIDAWMMKNIKQVYVEFEKDKEVRMFTRKFGKLH